MIELARLATGLDEWTLSEDGKWAILEPKHSGEINNTNEFFESLPRKFTLDNPADFKAAILALMAKSVVIGQMPEGLFYVSGPFELKERFETIEQAMIAAAKALENT